MILTEEQRKNATQQFQALPPEIQNLIRQSSVKLLSTNRTFTGSGVILAIGKTYATVVTAKHNLWVHARSTQAPKWDSAARTEMETAFRNNVGIMYGVPER